MRTLYVLYVAVTHAAALAFAIWSTRQSGVRTTILLYAFIADAILRLCSVRMFYVWMRGDGALNTVANLLTRAPAKGDRSQPLVEQNSGRPLGLFGHLAVMALLSMFAFVLANVDSDRQIRIDATTAFDDLNWAIAIGATYWASALVTRVIVIHPRLTLAKNFGYNTHELSILALSVLIGGVVVVIRQMIGLDASAWSVMGPLLGLRTLFDLHSRLKM